MKYLFYLYVTSAGWSRICYMLQVLIFDCDSSFLNTVNYCCCTLKLPGAFFLREYLTPKMIACISITHSVIIHCKTQWMKNPKRRKWSLGQPISMEGMSRVQTHVHFIHGIVIITCSAVHTLFWFFLIKYFIKRAMYVVGPVSVPVMFQGHIPN